MPASQKVLIVTDDADTISLVAEAIRESDELTSAVTEEQAMERLETKRPDIVLIDTGRPAFDGFEVCRRIRQAGRTPIIMLTPHRREEDIRRALALGADDYVTKPVTARLLGARMRTRLVPTPEPDLRNQPVREVRTTGGLFLDPESRAVTTDSHRVHLTPLEFKILYMLAVNEGRVIPYSRLVGYAWGDDGGDARLLRTHIAHIRLKLGTVDDQPGEIRTVPGVGYMLTRAKRT